MRDGIGDLIGLWRWGKGMIDNLKDISGNLENAKSDIADYDHDGVISFQYTSLENKYQDLYEDFDILHSFTGKVGDIVDRTIDQPFYKDMDAFVEAMRDLTISNYTTKNRIGATETQIIYAEGYGPYQSLEVPKTEVSLDDLLSGGNFFGEQMKLEYEAWKELNPDKAISEEEYRQAALNTRAFEYESIRNQQENKEFWVQLGALVVIVGVSIVCPPAGLALGVAYGTLELSSAVSGKDWVSGRELGTGERWFRGLLAPLDIIPGVGALKKLSGTARLTHIGEDTVQFSLKTGMKESFQKGMTKVNNLVNIAEQFAATRLKSAAAVIKDVSKLVITKLAKDIIEVGKLADSAVTSLKNNNPFRNIGWDPVFAGIVKGDEPVKNTHAMENKLRDFINRMEVNLNRSNPKLNKSGLTSEQERYFRTKIDNAEARGDLKAADDARYERYCKQKENLGETSLDRKEWDVMNERVKKNRERGREEETKGRIALEKHLNRTLEDNNADEVVTYTSSEGYVTRPDSIGRNDKGEIDLIHDHKHKLGGEDQVIYSDGQIRAEREMIEDKKNGSHVVTLSSDKAKLTASPPEPRPSGPLAEKSDIYFTDIKTGKVTHQWEPNPRLPGGGRWKKL